MNFETIENSHSRLRIYIENEHFKGFDPYDTLNSKFAKLLLGKWLPVIAIQFQKRNPVNIRPMLGIKKEINPKAIGLFLNAYSNLYKVGQKNEITEKMDFFLKSLEQNSVEGYSGCCWGYNFPWASTEKFTAKNTRHCVNTLSLDFVADNDITDTEEAIFAAGCF